MDITSTFTTDSGVDIDSPPSFLYTSCAGAVRQSLGGVGRNVAEAAYRAGVDTLMVSAVGNDLASNMIMEGLTEIGMRCDGIRKYEGESTAIYNALHSPDGQLISAVADMNVFKRIESEQIVDAIQMHQPNLICCDGNIESSVLRDTAVIAKGLDIPVHFEPTSIPKSLKIFDDPATVLAGSIKSISPNHHELVAMSEAARKVLPSIEDEQIRNQLSKFKADELPEIARTCLPYAIYLSQFFNVIVTKLGQHGCLIVGRDHDQQIVRYFQAHAIKPEQIKSVTGAGDSFVGVLLANLTKQLDCLNSVQDTRWDDIIHQSQNAAIRTLQSHNAVGS